MACKIDRRHKPSVRWEPRAADGECQAVLARISKAISISKVVRRG